MRDLAYLRRVNREAKDKHAEGSYEVLQRNANVSAAKLREIHRDCSRRMAEHRDGWFVRALEEIMQTPQEEARNAAP